MLSLELRDVVIDFVENRKSIQELEDWYIPRLPFFLANPNSTDSELLSEIEVGLAEYHDGILNNDELRKGLQKAVKALSNIIRIVSIDSDGVHEGEMITASSLVPRSTSIARQLSTRQNVDFSSIITM
ncbi:MAG: hypothetical protein ACE5FD_02485 [Anaerolineae bacterium]